MKIDIRPNIDQIRFFARSAMHAWDYQDLAVGRAQAIADMERLLAYLDAFDYGEGTVVAGVKAIKSGVRIELSTGDKAERRATEALRRTLTMPYKPQKEMVGKAGRPKPKKAKGD